MRPTEASLEAERPYPVRLEGRRDPDLSRWLWLVKWLLAIPHYVVLFFLGIAFFVLTVVAFFAILFTARYPRGIFDFNLGVLRWAWRVAFYSYAALGTDRYPPFTLGRAPDYPATLDVDYPAELSRGLVLVKWWLLAIPHYIVVGVFAGGGAWGADWVADAWWWGDGGGLITLLAIFAGVALLFASRYPPGIFDFVLGLDRWVARVVAYASLMTDRYPPFRLDQGGDDPEAVVVEGEPPAPLAPREVVEPRPAQRGAGGIALLVVGSIAALLALPLLAGGCATVVVDQVQRDDDGFLMSPTESFESRSYAIVSESADLEGPEWVKDDLLGTVRIRVESLRPVFLGIAGEGDYESYLGAVERSVVTELDRGPEYDDLPGDAPGAAPDDQPFWEASATGAEEQTVEWDPADGRWRVVLMNADGSRGVDAELSIGAELDSVLWIGIALLVAGGLLAAAAAVAITFGVRSGRR